MVSKQNSALGSYKFKQYFQWRFLLSFQNGIWPVRLHSSTILRSPFITLMRAGIVALAFIAITMALASEETTIDLISKIDNTVFGHTLFETIFVQLESGDPLDNLLDTLGSLEDGLTAEQKEDDASNRSFQDHCNVDLSGLDKEIAVADTYRISLEAKLEGALYPQRSILQGIVTSKTKEVREIQSQIDEADATRAEEKEEFEQKVDEHNQATQIITEARRLFEGLLQASSFLQKSNTQVTLDTQVLSLVQKKLHDGMKTVHKFQYRKSYSSLMKILATITNKAQQLADAGHLTRIVDLIDGLLQKISDSLDLERSAEDKRVAAHKQARKLLTITLQNAATVLANLQVELASTEDAITRTETGLENTEQRLDNFKQTRADRYEECEEAAHDYSGRREERDDQRNTVSQALGLVNSQLRTLREQLALRLAAGDDI